MQRFARPVDVRAEVETILEVPNAISPGRIDVDVALDVGGVYLVLTTRREQVVTPEIFTRVGIEAEDMGLLVVKSSQHFRAGFEPIAAEIIYCDTPGTLTSDLAAVPFTRVSRPIWPLDKIADGDF